MRGMGPRTGEPRLMPPADDSALPRRRFSLARKAEALHTLALRRGSIREIPDFVTNSMPVEPSVLDDLLVRTGSGDDGAFRALYDQTSARVFAVCLRIARNRALAEDILQESYVRIWERSRQFDPVRGGAMGWIITVSRNHAIDVVRASGREASLPETDLLDIADATAMRSMEAAIAAPALWRCLAALDEGVRRAIVLSYRDGLTYQELSVLLEIPLGTVKTWVRRGMRLLRRCLDETDVG